jgi:hypothetical protein
VPSDSSRPEWRWYRDLVLGTAHAVAWRPFAAATVVALVLGAVQHWTADRADAVLTFFVIVMIAAATASVIDDEAAAMLTTSTTPHRRRLLVRTVLGVTAGAASFLVVAATMRVANGSAAQRDLLLLWASLTALTIAIATVATRLLPDTSAALVGSGTLLSGAVLISATPPIPAAAALSQLVVWNEPGERFAWVIAASFAAFLWASRDPATR